MTVLPILDAAICATLYCSSSVWRRLASYTQTCHLITRKARLLLICQRSQKTRAMACFLLLGGEEPEQPPTPWHHCPTCARAWGGPSAASWQSYASHTGQEPQETATSSFATSQKLPPFHIIRRVSSLYFFHIITTKLVFISLPVAQSKEKRKKKKIRLFSLTINESVKSQQTGRKRSHPWNLIQNKLCSTPVHTLNNAFPRHIILSS